MLNREIHRKIVETIEHLPIAATQEGRDTLLVGIAPHLVPHRSAVLPIDIHKIIEQLYNVGRLEDTGIRPLVIFLENARHQAKGTKVGTELKKIIQEIDKLDQDIAEPIQVGKIPEKHRIELPKEHLEALMFAGSEERLAHQFFTDAIAASKSVARLKIPRYFGKQRDSHKSNYGTGWLITSDLLITNFHVIEARDHQRGETPATEEEIQTQVKHMDIWFEYYEEGASCREYQSSALVCWHPELDYALIRLDCSQHIEHRPPLYLAPPRQLYIHDRLNIAQYAKGGPLKFAIRNNFYYNDAEAPFICYITDTENGSSGAPVCNDDWQVVAMHCKSRTAPLTYYKSETLTAVNMGIEIASIIDMLPASIRSEIHIAQGRY